MMEKISEFLVKSLENSSQTVFLMETNKKHPFFANKQALRYYCNEDGTVEINSIFTNQDSVTHLINNASEQLKKKDYALLYDVSTTTSTGEIKICDIQVKYCDNERQVVFLELFPKLDHRMKECVKQMNQSHRATGIFLLDKGLTLIKCNGLFYDVFEMTPELAKTHYNNKLSNGFLPEVRESLLAEIHEKLSQSDFFTTKLKVITTKEEEKWYSLQLEKRTLDESGVDKIVVSMENIERQVETEEQLDDINQYFNIIQGMCQGLLYRFDIHKKLLRRNQESAEAYHKSVSTENFPNQQWLDSTIHPEDHEIALGYINSLIAGTEGTETVRMISTNGEFEYHKFTFKAIRHGDGSVKEMVGCATNIHNLKETQKELKGINQYFSLLQSMWNGTIYRFDVKNKRLHLNDFKAQEYGIPSVVENFPDVDNLKRYIHPDDLAHYLACIQEVTQGKDVEFEARAKSRGGEYVYFRMMFRAIRNKDGSIHEMIGTSRNIQEEKEKEEELKSINDYFSLLQQMWNGALYRLDIEKRRMIRSNTAAHSVEIPTISENYPDMALLRTILHPDDVQTYQNFIETVIQGNEGELDVRMKTQTGEFEYYRLMFRALRREDGTVREMVGAGRNVHHIKTTEKELVNINQYFSIIQQETLCTLFRYDIKTRTLYRNEKLAKEQGLPAVVLNYPNEEQVNRAIHPDFRKGFVDFFDKVVAEQEGSHQTRVLTVDGTFEYHTIKAHAVRNPDGSIYEMLITLSNVNDLTETESELKSVNQYFGAIQDLTDDLLYRIDIVNKTLIRREKKDRDKNFFSMNVVAENFPESIVEAGFIHADDVKIYLDFGHKALRGEATTAEVRMKSRTGEFGFRRIICVPVPSEDGNVKEMLGKVVNIQSVRTLEEKANYDSLTNALNKRAMLEAASLILSQSKSEEKHALLFIDLDDFKYVNDNLGHIFGDYLLTELGKRLSENVRSEDLIGRVGGDEFVVFLRDVPSVEVLLGKGKLLLSSISEDIVDGEKRHSIRGSVGVAVYPDHGTTYEELYHHADLALYHSKHGGKNLVTMYSADIIPD